MEGKKKVSLKTIALYKPRPHAKHNEGRFTPILSTDPRYCPYSILPICLPSLGRLWICVCSVICIAKLTPPRPPAPPPWLEVYELHCKFHILEADIWTRGKYLADIDTFAAHLSTYEFKPYYILLYCSWSIVLTTYIHSHRKVLKNVSNKYYWILMPASKYYSPINLYNGGRQPNINDFFIFHLQG